jgi:leader peptidase (prepilin peptidase)/N-methyltransferase
MKGLEMAIWIGFFASLAAVTVIDARTMIIPDKFHVIILALGILQAALSGGPDLKSRAIGLVIISLPMFLMALVIPGAFGGGDIKLMAACGFFLGWKITAISFLFAVLTGGIYGIWLIAAKQKERKEHFAFGPFLCMGMACAVWFGEAVVQWYLKFILF